MFVKVVKSLSRFIFFKLINFGCSVVVEPFVQKIILSPSPLLLAEEQLAICVGQFLAPYSVSLICVSVHKPKSHYLDYFSFIVSLDVR